jgi:glycosyltransferase involved in cell wall biosynthesis
MFKLCVCIPTMNRAQFIGQTLDSIVPELGTDVEVVIVDGSPDDATEEVVSKYQEQYAAIRYFRRTNESGRPSNAGFDRDCSWSVELARAEYCWLMTDDDLLKPGALRQVVARLDERHDLIVVACEVRDENLQETLLKVRPVLAGDVVFQPSQWERFFSAAITHLTFVGAVVIRRSVWVSRNPAPYFGSGFVHVGMIFSSPIQQSVLMLAQPLVMIRYGNAQWSDRAFRIFMHDWPQLIWSFPGITDAAKQAVTPREPWRVWRVLMLQRAYGRYSMEQYQRYVHEHLSVVARIVPRIIAFTPRLFLYVPARIYGYFRHPDPRLFVRTLNVALQQHRAAAPRRGDRPLP